LTNEEKEKKLWKRLQEEEKKQIDKGELELAVKLS